MVTQGMIIQNAVASMLGKAGQKGFSKLTKSLSVEAVAKE